jgi:hypothetical protein
MLTIIFLDWALERDQRAPANAEWLEERRHPDHSQPGWSDANDRKEHFPPPPEC